MAQSKADAAKQGARDAYDHFKEAVEAAQSSLASAREGLGEASGAAVSGAGAAADEIRESLKKADEALERARSYLSSVAARSREQAEFLYAETRAQYVELKTRSRKLIRDARSSITGSSLGQRRDAVLDFVADNPGTSVILAFGLGVTVGYLTRRHD